MAQLISTTDQVVLRRLPELIPIWLSVLAETEESQDGEYVEQISCPASTERIYSATAYSLLDAYDSEGEYEPPETPEGQRRSRVRV